jgi:chemotaxis protein methyltransferase CheR
MNPEIEQIADLIKQRTGLTVKQDNISFFQDILQNLMFENGVGSYSEFFSRVVRDPNIFRKIINELTINETYFFRESVHLSLVIERLIPFLREKKKEGEKIRILSAGCSTGEEPYSLAMAFKDAYPTDFNDNRFDIIGADIDSDALIRAEAGIYSRQSFRNIRSGFVDRYFEELDKKRYKISSDIRKQVEFHLVNLVKKPYPSSLYGIDIILYRNVSIYFDPNMQREIFENLTGILNEPGFLIVGITETLSHDFNLLPLVEMDGVFLYRKEGVLTGKRDLAEPALLLRKERTFLKSDHYKNKPRKIKNIERRRPFAEKEKRQRAPNEVPEKEVITGKELYEKALELVNNKEYERSFVLLEDLLKEEPGNLKAQTLKAVILLNRKQIEESREICNGIIQADPLFTEAYFISGLLAKFEGNHEEALKRFREALYLEPGMWPARFYLAQLYQTLERPQRAIHEYGLVVNLLENGRFLEHGLSCFPLIFTRDQIVRLCRQQLNNLKKT